MKKNWFAYPYAIWMVLFILVPFALVGYYAFTNSNGAFTLDNFQQFFQPMYLKVLWKSLVLAFVSTVLCLCLGYPLAMILASKDFVNKNYLLFLFILPMWMNVLLRTNAWMLMLGKNSIINSFFGLFGLGPFNMLYTSEAVVMGMIYNFLPFMVLPIYSVLCKIDKSIVEAASDLGADNRTIFRKITLPLSMPGVVSGIIMVFMPAVSTFIISRLLGGGQNLLIGNLIEEQFVAANNWNFGSAISMVMMFLILISMAILSHSDPDHEGGGLF